MSPQPILVMAVPVRCCRAGSTLYAPHFCRVELVPPQWRQRPLPCRGLGPLARICPAAAFLGARRERLQPRVSSSLRPPALKLACTRALPAPLPGWHFGAQWGITPMPEGSPAAPSHRPTTHAQHRAQASANGALAWELFGCLRLN